MTKNLISMAFICLILSACGAPRESAPQPITKVYNTSLSLTPMNLYKQVQACRDKRPWTSMDFGLHLYLAGDHSVEWKNFEGYIYNGKVKNQDLKVISNTEYAEEVEYVSFRKNFRIRQLVKPQDVDLCPDKMVYAQNTVESAALNASFYINKTHEAFKAATNLSVQPIKVKIAPKISQTIVTGVTSQTYYLTDNAYYQAENKTITFLPHSLEARIAGFGQNFWELPIVPSHEYGHHIFYSIFPYMSLKMNRIDLCFDNRKAMTISGYGTEPRKVNIEDVIHAYNEGFADLIAFYTLEETELSLKSVKCMESSRDVSSETFYDGTRKIFTEDGLNTFFANVKLNEGKSCEQVDYQDIHAIGAIFAHNADRFLSQFTDSRELKLKVLHDWVASLKSKHNRLSALGPERYFEEVFEIFLRLSLRKFDRKFDRANCNEVNRFYPGLVNRLAECL